jgi:hypothetical protein
MNNIPTKTICPAVFRMFRNANGSFSFLLVWASTPIMLSITGYLFPFHAKPGKSGGSISYSLPQKGDPKMSADYIAFTYVGRRINFEDNTLYAGLIGYEVNAAQPHLICACPFENWLNLRKQIPYTGDDVPVYQNPEYVTLYEVIWYGGIAFLGNPAGIVNQICTMWGGNDPCECLKEDLDLKWRKYEGGKFKPCPCPELPEPHERAIQVGQILEARNKK